MKIFLDFYPPLSLVRQAVRQTKRRIFLVGGAVRDYYLNRKGTDLDFAIDAKSITTSRQLARKIKGTFVLLDREHGSARVVKNVEGTPWTFDLTDWRGATIHKDLGARDFTINALAVDLGQDHSEVIEFKGARRDLKAGVIRMVSSKAFKDDPLRLLRAFALQATLGFNIESKTQAQIKKDISLIATVAAERIREEIFKVLTSPRAAQTLKAMDKSGLLAQVIPQITVMYRVHQGGYHHLDVWKHSLDVVTQLETIAQELSDDAQLQNYLNEIIGGGHSRLALLKMAALLHDIGKPETRRPEGKRMTFHGHEHVGEGISRQVAKQLRFSVKERYFVENAVRMHLRPGYLANFKVPSPKAVFRYFRDAKQEAVSLAILALADQAATRGPLTTAARHKHHAKICRMLIAKYFETKVQARPKPRLLSGHDLIKALKLKPSPLFGRILASVEEATALGKITTKQEALALAREIKTKHASP